MNGDIVDWHQTLQARGIVPDTFEWDSTPSVDAPRRVSWRDPQHGVMTVRSSVNRMDLTLVVNGCAYGAVCVRGRRRSRRKAGVILDMLMRRFDAERARVRMVREHGPVNVVNHLRER